MILGVMNPSDIQFLVIALAAALFMTALTFFCLRAVRVRSVALKALSAAAFPAFLIAIIVYVEVWNPDPHGFVMVTLGSLALVSLPITMLVAWSLAKRFA